MKAGPGRPKGVPNKATREFKDAARLFLESSTYKTSAERRMIAGKAPHLELFFHQHAYGKPKERVEHSGEVALPTRVVFELHPE